jgi:hypothetical protein
VTEGDAWWTKPAPTAAHPAATWSRDATPATRRPASPGPSPVRPPTPRPAGPAPFGDQRGLTAAGATLVVLLLATLAAAVDVTTGTGLRTVFEVTLVVAAALAACTVHTEDLLASVVLVPLVFGAVAGVSGVVEGTAFGSLSALIQAVAVVMINAAPGLMAATAVAALIAGGRAYAVRRRRGPGLARPAGTGRTA